MPPLCIIGAGSWGSALALLIAGNGYPVKLVVRDAAQRQCLQQTRQNSRYLPGFIFPSLVEFVDGDLTDALSDTSDVLIAVPSTAFVSVVEALASVPKLLNIAYATKGVVASTQQWFHELLAQQPNVEHYALLSGPSFAKEVAAKQFTAVSLVGYGDRWLAAMKQRCVNPYFRVYVEHDLEAVQLCGIVKNVLAIAVGVADGMQMGANARAALLTRGLAEVSRLFAACQLDQSVLMGLSGIGDIFLTCTDDASRNRRLGLLLASGCAVSEAKERIGQAVEGYFNVSSLLSIAQHHQVELPICEQVYAICYQGISPQQAVKQLVMRPIPT